MSVLTMMALLGSEADACGGFACNANRPVLQNAERIVFGLDPEANEVEMHVQITYTGPADDFSWIVPVPADPELFVTSSALFTRLALATQPRFNLNIIDEGFCRASVDITMGMAEYAVADRGVPLASDASGGTVNVVAEEAVGPYETVTLQAQSAEGLLAWLTDNGYDIPANFEDVLAPYIAQDAYFVALKLAKDRDVGDLAPLALRYRADRAMVPVQLTSISATPDMRMEAYILADTRAVPESYLHVRVNDAAIDWWTQGSNYNDVITEAADEAGGHAFATDYYGDADLVQPIWREERYDRQALMRAPNRQQWVDTLRDALRVTSPELFLAIEELLGADPGMGSFAWACPDCVSWSGSFDPEEATLGMEQRVIEPMRTAQRLLDRYEKLSRMTSSLDAIEMTVDPIFVLNSDLRDSSVRRNHSADLIYECRNGKARDAAKRRLLLKDGREILLPSERDLREMGLTEFEYISELGDKKAQVIEQMGESGKPIVIADFTADLFDQVRAFNGLQGCGCNSGASAGSMAGLGLLGLLAARRRR